jgi:hypothetical protein
MSPQDLLHNEPGFESLADLFDACKLGGCHQFLLWNIHKLKSQTPGDQTFSPMHSLALRRG